MNEIAVVRGAISVRECAAMTTVDGGRRSVGFHLMRTTLLASKGPLEAHILRPTSETTGYSGKLSRCLLWESNILVDRRIRNVLDILF